MTKFKERLKFSGEFAVGLIMFLAFIAVLKFLFNPTVGRLEPFLNEDGICDGWIYAESIWWGLAHRESPAWLEDGEFFYRRKGEKPEQVDHRLYESPFFDDDDYDDSYRDR
jgi:hypothetical protein